jgi:twitching motility protein PilT
LALERGSGRHVSGPVVLEEILRAAIQRGGTDLHLKVPSCPLLRVHGRLERLEEFGSMMPAQTQDLLAVMLAMLPHSAKQSEFERSGHVDFAYAHPGLGRFRVNAYRQRGSVSIVIRIVPFGVPKLADLGLPSAVEDLVRHRDGLLLVTGPVSSGVTSTLAALIDAMNDQDERNIITIEDPIELLHSDRRCTINQREVGLDVPSFAEGLDRVLGLDPDAIMVGKLPDVETIDAAVWLAESGVLVLSAMPSHDAGEAVERLVSQHPEGRRGQARAAIASCLRGVIAQRLLPGVNGAGRQLAVQVLIGTPEVRRAIAEGADAAALDAMIDGSADGMITFETSLAGLVRDGLITAETALGAAHDRVALAARLAG